MFGLFRTNTLKISAWPSSSPLLKLLAQTRCIYPTSIIVVVCILLFLPLSQSDDSTIINVAHKPQFCFLYKYIVYGRHKGTSIRRRHKRQKYSSVDLGTRQKTKNKGLHHTRYYTVDPIMLLSLRMLNITLSIP